MQEKHKYVLINFYSELDEPIEITRPYLSLATRNNAQRNKIRQLLIN
jgi:hypothetical protein